MVKYLALILEANRGEEFLNQQVQKEWIKFGGENNVKNGREKNSFILKICKVSCKNKYTTSSNNSRFKSSNIEDQLYF